MMGGVVGAQVAIAYNIDKVVERAPYFHIIIYLRTILGKTHLNGFEVGLNIPYEDTCKGITIGDLKQYWIEEIDKRLGKYSV